MKYTIEILNERLEVIETMMPVYSGKCLVTDHTGKHEQAESLKEFIDACGGIARQELFDRPEHIVIIYNSRGIPTEIYKYEDSDS